MASIPTLALTAGDPGGVGPEVLLKAIAAGPETRRARLVIIGDYAVFEAAARRLHRRLPSWSVLRPEQPLPSGRSTLLLDLDHRRIFRPGRTSREAGAASMAYLDCAVRLWRDHKIHGLVTAPVTKWAIRQVLPGFVGQTEYLAEATRARDVVMMFVSDRLRVALLTRHLPLRRVAGAINCRLIRRTVRLTARALSQDFHIQRPRLALCGVNPHAGERSLRSEEQRLMVPVLRAVRREGIRCDGPFAADGFFGSPGLASYDAVICAYHDQGLIPFKMAARDRGCQLSAGLPLIRTSPDHGSALDIAGRGIAHPGSMRYAIGLAAQLALGRLSAQ